METTDNDPRMNVPVPAPGEPAHAAEAQQADGAEQFVWFDAPGTSSDTSQTSDYVQYAAEPQTAYIPLIPEQQVPYEEHVRQYEQQQEAYGRPHEPEPYVWQGYPQDTAAEAELQQQVVAEPAYETPTYEVPAYEVPAYTTIPAYTIPETPEAGWDMAPSKRRDWVSRGLLLCILLLQAALSLRLHNSAFQDEALYLDAGHHEIAHLLHGTVLHTGYESYFSGSPQLYPVLAAAVESHFGLTGARLLSLFFMLSATTLLYAFTRRMFNERVALAGSAFFAVTQSTIVLGYFATYDAMAIFLLALAAWIIVRTDRAPMWAVLPAAPVIVLAVGAKYASALYVPTLIALAALTAWQHQRGSRALLRALVLCVGIGVLLGAGLHFTDVLAGVKQTTTNRAHGTDSTSSLIQKSAQWSGLMFAISCAGALSYAHRNRMNESPHSSRLTGPGKRWRVMLGLVLCGTALLAPAYQIHLHTSVSLYKHLGFGLLFAAPMAGIGVTRLMGAHFRYPQLGILAFVILLCFGMSQSAWRFGLWPDSAPLNTALSKQVNEKGHYLADTYEVPMYYLRDKTEPGQWTSTYGIGYMDAKGVMHHGNDGYQLAIRDGYFDVVVLDGLAAPAVDKFIAAQVSKSPRYRLLGTIPFKLTSGGGTYRIWVKNP